MTASLVQRKLLPGAVAAVSHTVTLDAAPTAGNLLVCAVASNATEATPAGWTGPSTPPAAVNYAGGYIFWRVAVAGDTGITVGSGSNGRAIALYEFGGTLGSPYDQGASAVASGVVSSQTTGTTAATTNAADLIFTTSGIAHNAPAAVTAWSNGVAILDGIASGTTPIQRLDTGWKNVTATGTQTSTATYASPVDGYGCIIVAFKTTAQVAADAGPDQTVQATYTAAGVAGPTVTLAGNGVAGQGGTSVTYAWTKVSGPAVTLSSTTAQNPTFTAPRFGGTFVFGLTVADNAGHTSSQDTVQVTVTGVPYGYVRVAGAWVKRPVFVRRSGAWS